jgi:hypothetical protein
VEQVRQDTPGYQDELASGGRQPRKRFEGGRCNLTGLGEAGRLAAIATSVTSVAWP